MADEIDELLGFLSSPSLQVKKAAVEIVRGLTGSDGGIDILASLSDFSLPPLCLLLHEPFEVSAPSAEALINLSQNPNLAEKLVSLRAVDAAMEVIYKQGGSNSRLSRLLVMLLVNLTQLDSGIISLLQVGDDKIEGLYLSKLVRSFCRSYSSDTTGDTYEHVASIFVNVSKMEVGRRILLQPKGILLKQIIRQSDSTNSLRKKGVSGTIRNCCFDADRQLQNLLMLSEFLWPALLLPVAGKKAYSEQDTSKMPLELANALSHEREPVDDPEIRKQALESLYLISLQIRYLQEDRAEVLPCDITDWTIHIIEDIPLQENDNDCDIFVMKLMKACLLKEQIAWKSHSRWSKDMPRIRAETMAELFHTFHRCLLLETSYVI